MALKKQLGAATYLPSLSKESDVPMSDSIDTANSQTAQNREGWWRS